MKAYNFAKVYARGPMTEEDYRNDELTDNLRLVINLTDEWRNEPYEITRKKKIDVYIRPISNQEKRFEYLLDCVKIILWRTRDGQKAFVFCDSDLLYSSAIIEAYHFFKLRSHLIDEYKGYKNHLIYLCETGFYPPLKEVEHEIKRISDEYDPQVQSRLKQLKNLTPRTCYNALAEKTEKFIKAISDLKTGEKKYKDLSPIMSCFKQVRVKDGYVLDGFQSGSRHSSHMVLHARRKEGTEYIPLKEERFGDDMLFFKAMRDEEESLLKDWIDDSLSIFDDSMYIRNTVYHGMTERLVKPIWEDIIVPFNEEGLWEAVLLYLAPRFMPGHWHWIYAHIEPVTSQYILVSKCMTIDDYAIYLNSDFIPPKVYIESDSEATVNFTSWGRYGLGFWELKVIKDSKSVRITKSEESPKSLIYYEPKFVV